MAAFGGWEMPIEYTGIIPEHLAVRRSAGLFDISHMGEILIEGPQSLALIQKLTSNDASRLQDGQIQYSALLNNEGCFVDDVLVHRIGESRYFLCVNASNTDKDFRWIAGHKLEQTSVTDASDRYAQLAMQGPNSADILQPLLNVELKHLRYYWFASTRLMDIECIVARTGYTGEDGFELYFAPEGAERVWALLLDKGSKHGLVPVGLGARNTLRLEAKMALYGHEISDQITPWEADLAWIVKLDKGGFIGKEALIRQKESGPARTLVGFEMTGKGIGRDGYPVMARDVQIGFVTSGGPSPTLNKNIGLAYVPIGFSQTGTEVQIQIRSQRIAAKIVPTPFYKKALKN